MVQLHFSAQYGIVATEKEVNMVEYVDGWNARVAWSRIDRSCAKCNGRIVTGMLYISRDDRRPGGKRWSLHEHVDCQAAWWQVNLKHLLKSVGKLPHTPPPQDETDPRLEGFDIIFQSLSDRTGVTTWLPNAEVRQQFLQTPDTKLRESAKAEIELAFGLFADVIIRSFGNQHAAMMLSNIIQQLVQVAEVTFERP